MERAAILSTDEVIHSYHLPPTLQTAESSGTETLSGLAATLDGLEREMIVEALQSSRGNMTKAARSLGITERIMGLRIRKHDIDLSEFKRRSLPLNTSSEGFS